jgi:hypothetical protein
MTGLPKHLRAPGIFLGLLAVIIATIGASFAVGYAASSKGNTIKACVAKHGGTIYQAKKCHKGDKKLSWSITGPQGSPGAAGANGAVAGFSAAQGSLQDITANSTFTTIVSKVMPAGSYVFTAKAEASATNSDNTVVADSSCRLTDGTASDTSQMLGPIVTVLFFHVNDSMHSMTLATTKAAPFTVSLQCENGLTSPPAGYELDITNGRITGVQTTTVS